MKFNNLAKNEIAQLIRRKDKWFLTYENGDLWSRFSMRFVEKVCVGANFDDSYLSQGSIFFNSIRCLCKRIYRILRITRNLMIWSRTYPCIQKIAWIGLDWDCEVTSNIKVVVHFDFPLKVKRAHEQCKVS